jgi:uncharacterized membrane protein YbhN (UPF0104 family)
VGLVPAMTIEKLLLLLLACGAATLPLSLVALRCAASLAPEGRLSRKLTGNFEVALSLSVVIWLVGALAFYVIALELEHQKPCEIQRTNQLSAECRKYFRLED